MSNSKYLNTITLQYKPVDDPKKNIKIIESLICNQKIYKNTLVICPELSIQPYICIRKNKKLFNKAIELKSLVVDELKAICKKYEIYLCITIFRKDKFDYYNTAIIIDPRGYIVEQYNKKNIPSEKCYEEKYYFKNSSNKFKYFNIGTYKIGIIICWDQWHYCSYLSMKRYDVNLIICPTAIGHCKVGGKIINIQGEKDKWLNVIKANSLMINTPIIISNRIGKEVNQSSSIDFWGSSFITDSSGNIVKKCRINQSVMRHKITQNDQITSKKMWNFIK